MGPYRTEAEMPEEEAVEELKPKREWSNTEKGLGIIFGTQALVNVGIVIDAWGTITRHSLGCGFAVNVGIAGFALFMAFFVSRIP